MPSADAVPSFAYYRDREGNDRNPPSIIDPSPGSGLFCFTPSDADEQQGVAYLIQTGAEPGYLSGAVHLADNSNQFWAFHFVDGFGAPVAGSCWIDIYTRPSGVVNPPPDLQQVPDAPLWYIVPFADDLAAGAAVRVSADAGMYPEFWDMQTLPIGNVGDFTTTVVSPAVGSALTPVTPVVVDVVGPDATSAIVVVDFPGLMLREVARDQFNFGPAYSRLSSSEAITGGLRLTLLRDTGWPASPTVSTY